MEEVISEWEFSHIAPDNFAQNVAITRFNLF
jgi:hypothetical protein